MILNDTIIREFSQSVGEIYRVFFRKYPFLKPVLFGVILYSSSNYGLIIFDEYGQTREYTIYSTDGNLVIHDKIESNISVVFRIKVSIMNDIVNNKSEYMKKPYKLFKYFAYFLRSISINKYSEKKYLIGERIYLRPASESDIYYLLKWYNDIEINKLAGWSNRKITAEKIRYNMLKSFGYDPMNLVIETLEGKPIGTIQLYEFIEQDRKCKLGIRIGDRDYWGKGYGKEAVNLLLEYAFMNLDMFRVSLTVYEFNDRAYKCYLNCGFSYEGRTRKSACIDGKYYDEIIMGILKSEYIEFNKLTNKG